MDYTSIFKKMHIPSLADDPNKPDYEPCWLWKTPCTNSTGRPYVTYGRKTYTGYAVTYSLYYLGPPNTIVTLPKGQVLRHTCNNQTCCNPTHLIPGTHTDNMQDMVRAQRNNKKLSHKEVIEIRQAIIDGTPHVEIANKYGVSRSTISAIKTGRLFRGIE